MKKNAVASALPFAFAGALLVALVAGCAAGPRPVKTSSEVTPAKSAEPAPAPVAAAAPGACTSDAACAPGEICASGRCEAAPRCGLVRVAFAFDSAQLDEPAMARLRDDARCLAQRRATALLVEGHADERGTTQYNVALGARRAEGVKRYLAELGVGARIETVSFGEQLPAAQGSGEAAWAQNRRAELRLPGDARSDGTLVPAR
jgi:peptidoglycan-associated lipoprotein